MTKRRIHLIYGIVLSIALIVSGLCLIIACVGIYRTGDPFTPQAVAQAFDAVDIPVYLSLVLILGGILLDILLPVEKAKKPVEKQYAVMLQKLHDKLDMEQRPPELRQAIIRQQRSRQLHQAVSLGLLILCSILFLAYGTNSRNFHPQDITASMVQAMKYFIPCLLIPFAYAVFTAYYCRRSIRREIDLVKQAAGTGYTAAPVSPAPQKSLSWLKTAVLVIAVGLLLFGLFTGGSKDVLTKAVNICTECVGLG